MLEGIEYHRGGSGEPLVAVHGIGSCWQVWGPVLPALEAQHDVFAPSLPGYGRSAPIAEEASVYALTDALERILDDAGIETAHFVGNSLGATIVAEIAARGRARSAVAIAPGGLALPREDAYAIAVLKLMYASARRLAPRAERLTATAAGRSFAFGIVMARPWRLEPQSAAHQLQMMAWSPSFADTLRWIDEHRPRSPGLDRISCPFSVVWGTRDQLLPVRQAHRWARIVPGARLELLRGLGHVPMVDDPELVASKILETTAQRVAVAA